MTSTLGRTNSMQHTSRTDLLLRVADALSVQGSTRATLTAKELLPWHPSKTTRGLVPKKKALRVFLRDRFVDRYSGSRLVFPGALLALGVLLPDAFPMSPTWKVSESHEVFYELWPFVDHIVPVTRHGTNAIENLVTTSSVNNSAKGTALLSELQWTLLPVPTAKESWDGMLGWFMSTVERHPSVLDHHQLKGWHSVALSSAA